MIKTANKLLAATERGSENPNKINSQEPIESTLNADFENTLVTITLLKLIFPSFM